MNSLEEVAPGRQGSDGGLSCSPTVQHVTSHGKAPEIEGAQNLFSVFAASATRNPDSNCLGYRPKDAQGKALDFVWISYGEALKQSVDIGSAMAAAGLQQGGRCAVFGQNSPQWMITMQGCNRQGLWCVPLYDTLGENAVEYILDHSESTIVFVSAANFGKLVAAYPKTQGRVKTAVCWGEAPEQSLQALSSQGVKVHTFEAFMALGAASPVPAVDCKRSDICTIMYTSGTTGDPKGVLVTHEQILSCVAGQIKLLSHFENVGKMNADDVFLSYLPLAHIFDRSLEELLLAAGASIGYYQGDVKLIIDDIAALRPTFFAGVPRVYDRVYSGILSKVKEAGGLKAFLFNRGLRIKLKYLDEGYAYDKASPFYDRLVFNKIKQRLGGRVRVLISGAAPLPRHVEDFLRVTMCCPVMQGYGLTETTGSTFVGAPNFPGSVGTVGFPLPNVQLRLESVPEMNYDALGLPARGEVCLRGPTVFPGYYKADDKTKEVMDADGFFHTGDVGEFNEHGALKIIDRKKNIFKLSQGEYVAVEMLESVYGKCPLTQQLWVYGNSYENTLVGVAVPEEEVIAKWARGAGIQGSFSDICSAPQTREHILKELTAVGKAAKLKGFELLKDLHVESSPFAVENDLLTPTFKLKRPQLQKHYQTQIDAMYKNINSRAS